MRILMLNNEFPPIGGGTGTVNEELLKQYVGDPELLIDLVTGAAVDQFTEDSFAENIRIFRIPVGRKNIHHASNIELLVYAWRAFGFARKLESRQTYDLILAWSTVPAGGTALALSWFQKVPYYVRVTGPDIPGFEERYRWLYPVIAPIIKAIWRHATVIVAKCREEQMLMRNLDHRVQVKIIPNGVDNTRFQPGATIPDDEPLRVICVARLIERKGQDQLIKAVAMLAREGIPMEVFFVGTGDSEEVYRAAAFATGVGDQIHFLGYIPREDIPAVYAQAHIFVLPSFNEGMSVSALEAMSSGLPLLLTQSSNSGDLVSDGVNGFLFKWGDVEMLGGHLRRLSQDRTLAREMGRASRSRALAFSWQSVAQEYKLLWELSSEKKTVR